MRLKKTTLPRAILTTARAVNNFAYLPNTYAYCSGIGPSITKALSADANGGWRGVFFVCVCD